ncbi:tyrosine-type recombinase/integrase [Paraglaciecola chathamensis]|uniref:Tyrosine-type recombinase/integrase n=1 Tax=Paraglaciecola chathamensis TaxID=368405 RepID=A0ABS0WAR6_9ALTE|nr:tyrosine-type recombinase/integrase [Paraglaciecola chathamensis]MBJ2135557.1 tyrosine-type recombinase/integrase [Paraglaciecola chathamensis]
MAVPEFVSQLKYSTRVLDFYCVIDDAGYPIFAPSMFLFHLAKNNFAQRTIKGYAYDLASFFTALNSTGKVVNLLGTNFRDVDDPKMTAYLDGILKKQMELADATIERHIATLTSFYKFSYTYGLISEEKSFTFKYGEEEVKMSVMQGITTKLHETYMNEATFKDVVLSNAPNTSSFLNERNKLALMLGYHAGFRTEELVMKGNLDVSKLRKLLPKEKNRVPRAITLEIKGKGNKMRGAQITVEVTTAIYDFLWGRAKHIKTNLMSSKKGIPLTNTEMGTQLFRKCINNYKANTHLSKDDIEVWDSRTFHTLRKCYATNSVMYCIRKGIDSRVFVTQWMGHDDPKTTEIYIFYDAVLNSRIGVTKDLSLQDTVFGQLYKNKYNKTGAKAKELS